MFTFVATTFGEDVGCKEIIALLLLFTTFEIVDYSPSALTSCPPEIANIDVALLSLS